MIKKKNEKKDSSNNKEKNAGQQMSDASGKPKKAKKKSETKVPDNILPQNILRIGESVVEGKKIYILQSVYKEIHAFTKNKTTNESGGMLVGDIIEEFGKTNIIISGFVEAKYSQGTPTTLKFTHETWDYVHEQIDKKHKGKKIVGWIHTHPDFGIFLSEYDKFIHQNFFSEDYEIAYVVDPIKEIEGFYFWLNDKIEKSSGFYIYDATGKEITIEKETKKDESSDTEKKSIFSIKNLLMAVLSIIVVFLCFSNISANKSIEELRQKQDELTSSLSVLNQYILSVQQSIANCNSSINALIDDLTEAGVTAPTTTEATTEAVTEASEDETENENSTSNKNSPELTTEEVTETESTTAESTTRQEIVTRGLL